MAIHVAPRVPLDRAAVTRTAVEVSLASGPPGVTTATTLTPGELATHRDDRGPRVPDATGDLRGPLDPTTVTTAPVHPEPIDPATTVPVPIVPVTIDHEVTATATAGHRGPVPSPTDASRAPSAATNVTVETVVPASRHAERGPTLETVPAMRVRARVAGMIDVPAN
jgi:hypothetical protein